MCENLLAGTAMGWTATYACALTMLRLQYWQSLHQAWMSLAIPFHLNLAEISCFEAITPGLAILCKALQMAFLKERGTKGLGALWRCHITSYGLAMLDLIQLKTGGLVACCCLWTGKAGPGLINPSRCGFPEAAL